MQLSSKIEMRGERGKKFCTEKIQFSSCKHKNETTTRISFNRIGTKDKEFEKIFFVLSVNKPPEAQNS